MKITMEVWAVAVLDRLGGGLVQAAYYYNEEADTFQRECAKECVFVSEEAAHKALEQLNIEGLGVVVGTMVCNEN